MLSLAQADDRLREPLSMEERQGDTIFSRLAPQLGRCKITLRPWGAPHVHGELGVLGGSSANRTAVFRDRQ
jgi:hypothetical protein